MAKRTNAVALLTGLLALYANPIRWVKGYYTRRQSDPKTGEFLDCYCLMGGLRHLAEEQTNGRDYEQVPAFYKAQKALLETQNICKIDRKAPKAGTVSRGSTFDKDYTLFTGRDEDGDDNREGVESINDNPDMTYRKLLAWVRRAIAHLEAQAA